MGLLEVVPADLPPRDLRGDRQHRHPLAAKLAQAARMLAASAWLSGLNGSWNGAFGRSNRYDHSDLWVATRGPVTGGSKRSGALSSLNS